MTLPEPREILKLARFPDGSFGIYDDGVLVEVYVANEDTWHIALPLQLWRHFNAIVKKRIKEMDMPLVTTA